MSKVSNEYDFFTEITIVFPISSIEHKIKLAVYGIFKKQIETILPIPVKYEIIEIKLNKKIIKSTPKIIKYVNVWIKNNPNKFSLFITTELAPMLSSISKNKSRISKNNPIDKR